MEISAASLHDQIPYYLTRDQKEGLLKALKDFPRNTHYYLTGQYKEEYQEKLLQGDGWTKLKILNFYTGEKASINGIVLSNTCDVTPENARELPVNIVFAPIVPLSAYSATLEKGGISSEKIQQKILAIKAQQITTIFYLPVGDGLDKDHIVLLDDIHTIPAKAFEQETEKSKQFTLSLFGFYLFVFKLSVHFCRLHEGVNRA
ncbi:hypothetical protein [Methyloglobulus sp.]|uniref:hypothetical protein n=1 Tax=Methyloglobulus sp. TaxID=2518622 RepID=UPI00398A45DB